MRVRWGAVMVVALFAVGAYVAYVAYVEGRVTDVCVQESARDGSCSGVNGSYSTFQTGGVVGVRAEYPVPAGARDAVVELEWGATDVRTSLGVVFVPRRDSFAIGRSCWGDGPLVVEYVSAVGVAGEAYVTAEAVCVRGRETLLEYRETLPSTFSVGGPLDIDVQRFAHPFGYVYRSGLGFRFPVTWGDCGGESCPSHNVRIVGDRVKWVVAGGAS